MADTVYSYRVRTVECDNCRAPLTGALEGGQVTCTFCGASLQIAGRKREHREETRIAEPDRLAGLRAQRETYDEEKALLRDPEALRPFRSMLATAATRAAGLEGLRQEWEKVRRVVAAGGGGTDGETHLLRVAIIVALTFREVGDHARARAILETALELLSDGEHRDIVRCRLVQAAIRAGDPEAAAAWLEEVNPRPIKLEVDHEVRVARAMLQLARGEHARVLETVGRKHLELPLLHQLRPHCLRAHALAGLGETEAARQEIGVAVGLWNSEAVAEEWQLCPGPSTALVGEATAKYRRGVMLSLMTFGAIVAASCFGTCMTPMCISTVTCGDDGLYNLAMHRLRECPASKEALGEPIEWAIGPSSCSGEGSGGCKDGCGLPWTMRVKGSKARGRIRVEASRWQGRITLITGDLYLGDRVINFKDCR